MKRYPETELILNQDGAVYHLNLRPEQIADNIILVGDPGRVKIISAFFQSIETKVQNRELITVTGRYKGTRISVISTGMGTDNIDIVLNELDALANIDLLHLIDENIFTGITITAPGFYAPQGRTLRIGSSWPEMVDKIRSFNYKDNRVLNFEMESSALFGLGQLMGHKTFTICIAIANRITRQYSNNYHGKLLQLIEMVLEGFTKT